jgi:hypothetical protein
MLIPLEKYNVETSERGSRRNKGSGASYRWRTKKKKI